MPVRSAVTMKNLLLVAAGLALVAGLLLLGQFSQTVCALSGTAVEITFVVEDGVTGGTIPGAVIELRCEERGQAGPALKESTLLTDDRGRAHFFRQWISCEDIINGFRRVKTFYDLTWGSYSASAVGYVPVRDAWLHESGFSVVDDSGSGPDKRLTRLEVHNPLRKADP